MAKRTPRFTGGTFNLRNLAKPGHEIYGRPGYTASAYGNKIRWTGDMIRRIGADFFGFQELFHEEPLHEALEASGVMDGAEVLVDGITGDNVVAGLVTTFPVVSWKTVTEIPANARMLLPQQLSYITEFSRPLIVAKLDIFGMETLVGVSHLKSKRPLFLPGEDEDNPEHIAMGELRSLMVRGVEAVGIRHLLVKARSKSSYPTILIGDANDAANSVTSRIICGREAWSGDSFEEKLETWRLQMWDAVEVKQRGSLGMQNPYTFIYNGRFERLDGITISRELYPFNPDRLATLTGVRVFNDHLLDWRTHGQSLPNWMGDHGLLTATFKMKD